jgi:GAF domain-containing protein
MRLVSADAASLHFARKADDNPELAPYIYEAWEGRRYSSIINSSLHSLGEQALRERSTLAIPDKRLGHDADYVRQADPEAYKAGIKAEAAIPIFVSDETEDMYADTLIHARKQEKEGLLYVRFERPHFFTKGEIDWLKLLAVRAVQAIRQATYYTRERDRARRLTHMQAIARSLAEDPESADLLEEIAGAARNILAADIVSVYEFDQENDRFVSRKPTISGRLINRELVTAGTDPNSAPTLLLRNAENVYADDVRLHPILSPKRDFDNLRPSFVSRERVKSAAALILKARTTDLRKRQNEIVGIMFINYRNLHRFSLEEQRVSETISSVAAIAIRNRRELSSSYNA